MSLRVVQLNSGSVKPIQYSHIHDSTLTFPYYRENFNIGLTINDYLFNQIPKDKKTNFDTQYTLTNLYPLSTILELNIPHTTASVSAFTSTIKQGTKYIRTDFDKLSAGVVPSTEFNRLSSNYFYTFSISTLSATNNVGTVEKRVGITQTHNNETYHAYISSGLVRFTKFVPDKITAGYPYAAGFKFNIEGDNLNLYATEMYKHNPSPQAQINAIANTTLQTLTSLRIFNNSGASSGTSTYLSGRPVANFTAAVDYATSNFTVNRRIYTKDFKYIPNSYVEYTSSFNADTVDLNTSTSVQHVSNNYFVFGNNYRFTEDGKDIVISADLFPLKNQATLKEYYSKNNHFNGEPNYLNRVYEKIHSGSNQVDGYEKIGLSYNIGTYDMTFKSNKLTYFTTPNSISPYTRLNINDSKIENLGSIPGEQPLLSDKVFKRRTIAKNNSFSDDVKPTYLCSWLSGNQGGETKWVDRYYNSKISSFSNALTGTTFYKTVTSASMSGTEMFDVSSNLVFEPNNDYIYYHIGDQDYENLFKAYDSLTFSKSVEFTNSKNVPIAINKSKQDDEIVFDGDTYGRFTTDHVGDFSVNFWLDSNTFERPFCHKILGNIFGNQGFSIFNTDLVTPNIMLPSGNKILFLNNDLEVYDTLTLTDKDVDINIKGIGRRDNYSNYFVLGENNVIYEFSESSDLVSKYTSIDKNTVIDDFEVSENKITALFNPVSAKKYFEFNTSSNSTPSWSTTSSVSADTVGKKGKIVEVDTTNMIYEVDSENGNGNEVAHLNDDTPIILKQNNPNIPGVSYNFLQKGIQTDNVTNTIVSGLSIKSNIQGVVTNDDNQIIVLHDNNRISILDENRKLLKTRKFCNQITGNRSTEKYIDLIYDFKDNNYEKYILLVETNKNNTQIYKIDYNLKINNVKRLTNVSINSLSHTKTVTSYSYLKKIGANKSRIKVVLSSKPKFTTTGRFTNCKQTIDFDAKQLNAGYNHFFVNVSFQKGLLELYVNGKLYQTNNFEAGKYILDNVLGSGIYIGAVSTPYFLTLANKLRQPGKYFVNGCKMKGLRMYSKPLNYFDILAHYNYHVGDKDVIWSYPLGQRTYVDTIDKLIKFNLPEKISNKYQIDIQNLGITDDKLNDKLKVRIEKELPKITPLFDSIDKLTLT